ncbi:DUF5018-related domain-containing protein [Bacteroides pyogenes]|uniref:DUF5018 domain-containing protein n=1 Tax=Bacteroides pyogenes TaxID=310300 RepID=A0A5D3EYL6_9BACE|nr:hypothetical protein [Bacteroides pyogenes]MBR8707400.1 hypothetical protein [Bacteroides pyogenes]MBR8716209.1 hypothetical protein [Bacteroides pyogenes]MBR8745656.1 hypothetical protein [Bacteroides pyogenes]MBR8756045.1 hypothetical protein [Bacteroides pyogenes]MBR8779269.1 hypothetical protein [Bacteroides pyogenes]
MKKLVNTLFLLCAVISLSSCLKSGLEDLPEYEDAEILSVHRVEYRFISQDVSNASGQPIVKFATLTHRGTVNKEEGTVAIKVTVPNSFPKAELPNLDASKLVVSLNLSSAARIVALEGSAQLGTPADWTKENRYVVTAANGTKKEWKVSLVLDK